MAASSPGRDAAVAPIGLAGPQAEVGRQRRGRLAALRHQRDSSEQMPFSNTSQAISAAPDARATCASACSPPPKPTSSQSCAGPRRERRQRIGRLLRRERQARQRDIEQDFAGAAAACGRGAPAVQPVRRRLQRPKAAFSAGTRSVFSHVKVPFSSSGSRPKWP